MLKINKKQMKVFKQLQFQKLKEEIDSTLSDEVTEWSQFDSKKQKYLVDFLFLKASKAKMTFDSEYILFALLCMSSNDCKSFLDNDDVRTVLLDDELNNGEKLIKLSDFTTIEIKKNNKGWEIKGGKNSV